MITDKKLTAWLFYQSPYKHALDINEYLDPKYLDLNFPHRDKFCDKLVECSLQNFVSTLIWIFKDKYPVEYSYIESKQMEWDEQNKTLIRGTNIRKAQDIYPLEFKDDNDVIGFLDSLKIKFKSPQAMVTTWAESVLEGKNYTKEESGNATTYYVSTSAIETLEVTSEYVLINLNKNMQ